MKGEAPVAIVPVMIVRTIAMVSENLLCSKLPFTIRVETVNGYD